MEIKRFADKNGRAWYYGKGTADEVDRLNIEKDFNTALDVLQSIRKTRSYLFDRRESPVMDRSVYGKREDVWKKKEDGKFREVTVHYISRNDLVKLKQHFNRACDRKDITRLKRKTR